MIVMIADYKDKKGQYFQLFKTQWRDETSYTVASDAIDVSYLHRGACWCVEFGDDLSGALKVWSNIILNAEKNGGVVDLQWVVDTYGVCTC